MIALVGNHLWQSTLFAAAAGVLALILRHNQASLRFWLWLTASVKFLIPFSALVAAGRILEWRSAPAIARPAAVAIATVTQPFSTTEWFVVTSKPAAVPNIGSTIPIVVLVVWLAGCVVVCLSWWISWRRVAATARAALVVAEGRVFDCLRRLTEQGGFKKAIPIVSSATSLEPGIFGILKPVLLWPRHMTDRLDDIELDAIIAHELCHVRRRDNLFACVHMFVEAVFWFHPLVWWIGGRLLNERERACDEEVILLGAQPHVYAEGILKTCEFCIESPLINVAGVTGADLKKRIQVVMSSAAARRLTAGRKGLLAIAAACAVVMPILLGAQSAAGPVPAFEVVSVKQNKSGDQGGSSRLQPGGYAGTNVTVRRVIDLAYLPLLHHQILGGPNWIDADHFDIAAKAGSTPGPSQLRLMLRAMLGDRFKLVVHAETRELQVYALEVVRADRQLGRELRKSQIACSASSDSRPAVSPQLRQSGREPPCGFFVGDGALRGQGVTIKMLAQELSLVGRVVLDRTRLDGPFDVDLKWTPDDAQATSAAPSGGSIFTALQEQLGLKLVPARGPVDVLVIDGAEHPTPD